MQRALLLSLLVGSLLALASCGDSANPKVTVGAAADLQFAFQEIAAAYEQSCGCDVVLTFGSSGKFATQIREGLPVDIFASANISYVEDLERQGLILPDSKQLYAIGRIVLAVRADSDLEIRDINDITDPAIRKLSIASPDHAPYGMAAKEALQNAGLWAAAEPKLVLGENAAQATQFVEMKDAEAGLVPLSLAIQRGERLKYVPVDESLYEPLRQAAAVLSRSKQPDLARMFLAFVNGQRGRPIMAKYGFVLPGEESP